jgi:hypothetical protein
MKRRMGVAVWRCRDGAMRRAWIASLIIIAMYSVFAVAQDDFAPIYIADGYDAPVGTVSERHSIAA